MGFVVFNSLSPQRIEGVSHKVDSLWCVDPPNPIADFSVAETYNTHFREKHATTHSAKVHRVYCAHRMAARRAIGRLNDLRALCPDFEQRSVKSAPAAIQ